MCDLIIAIAKLAQALTSVLVLMTVIFGVPILFFAGIEAAICFFSGSPFTWSMPLLVGIGMVIFICLVVSDAKWH